MKIHKVLKVPKKQLEIKLKPFTQDLIDVMKDFEIGDIYEFEPDGEENLEKVKNSFHTARRHLKPAKFNIYVRGRNVYIERES